MIVVGFLYIFRDFDFEFFNDGVYFLLVLVLHHFEDIPDWLENEINAKRPIVLILGLRGELLLLGVIIVVTPHVLQYLFGAITELFGQELSEALN